MKKIAIIGAGISGLFIANLFKKNPNYQISIYEKNNSVNLEEGYGIQLSVNSIKLLNEIGFNKQDELEKFNPEKIDFYSINNSKKICELRISDFKKKKNTLRAYICCSNSQYLASKFKMLARVHRMGKFTL